MWLKSSLLVAVVVIVALHGQSTEPTLISGSQIFNALVTNLAQGLGFTKEVLNDCASLQPTSNCTLETIFRLFSYTIGVPFCASFGNVTGTGNTTLVRELILPQYLKYLGLEPFSLNSLGGEVLCSKNCNGTCVPTDNSQVPSLYPIACKCSSIGCDANGPVGANRGQTALAFTTRCDPEPRCLCNNVDSNDTSGSTYNGYVCSWWTIQNKEVQFKDFFKVNATITYPSLLSPIRWCECCPKNSTGPPPSNDTTTTTTTTPGPSPIIPSDSCPVPEASDLVSMACSEGPNEMNPVCDFDCWCIHKASGGACSPINTTSGVTNACLCNYNGSSANKSYPDMEAMPFSLEVLCHVARSAYFTGRNFNICDAGDALICGGDCQCLHGARDGTCVNGPPSAYSYNGYDINNKACNCTYGPDTP